MTKRFSVIILCLLLAACIPVEDFGDYKVSTVIDPALVGLWDQIEEGQKKDGVKIVHDKEIKALRIDSMDEKELRKADYQPLAARTLKAGTYTFLMIPDSSGKGKGGSLTRYRAEGEVVTTSSLRGSSVRKMLEQRHPKGRNIQVYGERSSNVSVTTLDKETYEILSAIPDTPEYWEPMAEYRRHAG